jgi:hypothetical protein
MLSVATVSEVRTATQINAGLQPCGVNLARRWEISLEMTAPRPRVGGRTGRIEMSKTRRPVNKPTGSLAAPLTAVLALKAVALAVLYFAFFQPSAVAPAATIIFGLR